MSDQMVRETRKGQEKMEDLKKLIREVPDWPRKGVLFYDLTTLIKDRTGFHQVIEEFANHYAARELDLIVGIEARGFIFGSALAYRLGTGFVPVRKLNKLPATTTSVTYDLEYGSDSLEIHSDAIQPGNRVLIVDDLLATGGTACACLQLLRDLQAFIAGVGVVVELEFLAGRSRLNGVEVFSLLKYQQ